MGLDDHLEDFSTVANGPASGAKVALVDPVSLEIVWSSVPVPAEGDPATGLPLDVLVPMAEAIGLPGVLREVAATGISGCLEVDVITSNRGTVTLVVTVHRIPRELLLIVVEPGWRARKDTAVRNRGGWRRPQD